MIVDSREVLKNGQMVSQYLMQWSDSSPNEASWEDAQALTREFAHFSLVDKAIVQGRGSDTSAGRMEKDATQAGDIDTGEAAEVEHVTQARNAVSRDLVAPLRRSNRIRWKNVRLQDI